MSGKFQHPSLSLDRPFFFCSSTYRKAVNNTNCNETLVDDDICWEAVPSIKRNNTYRMFLVNIFIPVNNS